MSLVYKLNNNSVTAILFVGRGAEPPYTIIQEPSESYPEFLVADIHLPNVVSYDLYLLDWSKTP